VPKPSAQDQSIAGSVLPLSKAEELLRGLADVVNVRIVADSHGAVEAIHVLLLEGSVSPKQMVRNVESALMAQFGMRVDHRKVSIATTTRSQLTPPEITLPPGVVEAFAKVKANITPQTPTAAIPAVPSAPAAAKSGAPGRTLYFEDVEIRGSRTQGVTCKVTLRRGEQQFVGEAEGFESERSRVELAARATLAAIAQTETFERKFSLEGAKVVSAFDREVVLVGIQARAGRENTLLLGSCEVKDSTETASALGVLNATNRWVEGVR